MISKEVFMEIQAMHRSGKSIRVIAKELGLHRATVTKRLFARYYGFQPRLCASYSPWMKGKVERPIDYLRERFWRGYHFSSICKADEDVLVWLNEFHID